MGLSQEQLARRLGVTFQQIQKYERGTSRIGASRLFELAHILQVSVDWFFEGCAPESPSTTAAAPGLAEPGASFDYDTAAPPAREGPRPLSLDRREVLELVRHYSRIGDEEVRRRLYELTRALAAVRWRPRRRRTRG